MGLSLSSLDPTGWSAGGINIHKAAASAIPGIGEYIASGEANEANKEIASARNAMEVAEAKKQRDWTSSESVINRGFQAGQAEINREFQERLSSSAVQRRMQDMKKAGINPILAGKFDASTPAGAMAAGSQGAGAKANAHGYDYKKRRIDPTEAMMFANSAMDVMKKGAEINNIKAATGLTGEKTTVTEAIAALSRMITGVIEQVVGNNADQKNIIGKVTQAVEDSAKAAEIRKQPGIELTPYAESKKNRHKKQYGKRGPK